MQHKKQGNKQKKKEKQEMRGKKGVKYNIRNKETKE